MDQQVQQVETPTQDLTQEQPDSAPVAQDPAAEPAPTGVAALKQKAAAGVAPPVADPAAAQAAVAAAVDAFKPNYKFRASNKEHEIPEFMRGVIKDKDSEKFVHDLFEKAYGLPALKQRFQEQRQEYQELSQFHNGVMSQIEEAKTAYQRNDLDTMFEIFRVSPEKVLQWAVHKVQLSQLPPEQQQAYEAQRAAEKRARELEKTQNLTAQENSQLQSQHLAQMLDLVLERPDYSAVAQAYDTRKGKQGSFRELVARVGESEFALTGKVITPLEAAKKAVELLGEVSAPAPASAPAAAPAPQAPQAAQTNAAPKKTLPNLANASAKSGSAPAKSKMKSLDDVRKRHQEMMGS